MSERGKRITHEQTTVNQATGEVTTSTHSSYVEAEPDYVKQYLDHTAPFHLLASYVHNVLLEMLKELDYEQRISLTSMRKKEIAKKLGFELVNTVDQAILRLTKAQVLFRVGRSVFEANPYLLGRGKWPQIKKYRKHFYYDEKKRQYFRKEAVQPGEKHIDNFEAHTDGRKNSDQPGDSGSPKTAQ